VRLRMGFYCFVAFLCLGTATLQADDAIIKPVDIDLRIYPDKIHATFDTNKCYWFAAVLGLENPPTEWTVDAKTKIQKYVEAHFRLWVDGEQLTSRMGEVRYVEGWWKPDSLEARLIFEMTYPIPKPNGHVLKLHAAFFQEDWIAKQKEAKITHEIVETQSYETHLHVHARKPVFLELTMKKPDYELPLATVMRYSWQVKTDVFLIFFQRYFAGLLFALVMTIIVYRFKDHFY